MQVSNDNGLGIIEKTACVGAGVYGTSAAINTVMPRIQTALANQYNTIPQPSLQQVGTLIKTMQKTPELAKTKLKLFFLDNANMKASKEEIKKIFEKSIDNIFPKPSQFKDIFKKNNSNIIEYLSLLTSKGKNAFYLPTCDIAVAPKVFPIMITHEIGHAINSNKFKYAKPIILAMKNPLTILGMTIFPAIGIWKACGKKEDKSFFRDNAGKLTFAAFIPTLAEEGLATVRAIKNSITCKMPKEIIKNQAKLLGLAFTSYLACATIAGMAAAGCVKLASAYANARKD